MANSHGSKLIHNVLTAHKSQIGFTDALFDLGNYVNQLEDSCSNALQISTLIAEKLQALEEKLKTLLPNQ